MYLLLFIWWRPFIPTRKLDEFSLITNYIKCAQGDYLNYIKNNKKNFFHLLFVILFW